MGCEGLAEKSLAEDKCWAGGAEQLDFVEGDFGKSLELVLAVFQPLSLSLLF